VTTRIKRLTMLQEKPTPLRNDLTDPWTRHHQARGRPPDHRIIPQVRTESKPRRDAPLGVRRGPVPAGRRRSWPLRRGLDRQPEANQGRCPLRPPATAPLAHSTRNASLRGSANTSSDPTSKRRHHDLRMLRRRSTRPIALGCWTSSVAAWRSSWDHSWDHLRSAGGRSGTSLSGLVPFAPHLALPLNHALGVELDLGRGSGARTHPPARGSVPPSSPQPSQWRQPR
jgi:hypothetical protein